MSIHQPRSEIFKLFDQVGILSQGEMVFFGGSNKLVPYFDSIGYPCPTYANPLDHYGKWIFTKFLHLTLHICRKWMGEIWKACGEKNAKSCRKEMKTESSICTGSLVSRYSSVKILTGLCCLALLLSNTLNNDNCKKLNINGIDFYLTALWMYLLLIHKCRNVMNCFGLFISITLFFINIKSSISNTDLDI